MVYGPGQKIKRFVPQVISSCLKDKPFPVTSGNQFKDFTYIDDFVDALFSALEFEGRKGVVLNIASGVPTRIDYVVNKIVDLVGGGSPKYGELCHRKGENLTLFANTERASKLLKWSPKVSLEEGLKRTIDYYKKTNYEK